MPMTRVAPRARATMITNRPMVPQPKTATVLPRRSAVVQACTALPKGSCRAATFILILRGSVGHRTLAGSLMYSAKQPSRPMPMITSWLQMWVWPMRHW